jgi:signal peptidase II
MTHQRLGWLCAGAVFAADQVSKWWILEHVMNPPRFIEVTPFFNLVLVWNRGITFGVFSGAPDWIPWVLIAFALIVAVALAVWLRRADAAMLACALGAVIGGAVGNVIDRLRFGAVVDFLDFHAFGYHWPAFNVADSAIVIGVGLLMLDSLKSGTRNP